MRTLKKISELADLRGALRPYPGGAPEGPGAHYYTGSERDCRWHDLVALRVADKQQLKTPPR